MRYFRPRFKIATLAGEQDRLLSKIGGLPWGLREGYWPFCCGRPQKLLAQLKHDPPRLDLGAPGLVLHLFQCMDCLGIDDCGHDSVLLPESMLGQGLSTIEGWNVEGDLGGALIGEFWIEGWEERDDGIPGERLPEFFDYDAEWALHDEFSEIDWYDLRDRTRFGGTPRWTGNGGHFLPAPPFEFLFQVNDYLFLDGPPPTPNEVGCGVTTYTESSKDRVGSNPDAGYARLNAPCFIMHERGSNEHYAEFTNLGSDGTVFVFIDRTRQPHEVKWLWTR